jgi:PAS domain S-box-containing protein
MFLRSGGVGRDLLKVDWAATSLGPPEGWPRSLQAVVRLVLSSRFPMWMTWGEELTFLCNDAYRRDILDAKYPWALGKPAATVWAETWCDIGTRIDRVLSTGEATWDEKLLVLTQRGGHREEAYHTVSCSPLRNDSGAVRGVLGVVSDDTERVISSRRLRTLRAASAHPAAQLTEAEAIAAFCRSLESSSLDLPFHLVYLEDGDGETRLAGRGGFTGPHPAAPAVLAPGSGQVWPRPGPVGSSPVVTERVDERFANLPSGGWDQPPSRAAVLPIPGHPPSACGFLVVGLNPFHPFDAGYVDLLQLVAAGLGSVVSAARTGDFERQRAESLVHLDQAQRLASLGSWEVDLDNGVIQASDELQRIVGRTCEELQDLGFPGLISEVVHPQDRTVVMQAIATLRAGGDVRYEVRVLRPDGGEVSLSVRGVAVADVHDGPRVLRGSVQDVTAHRKAVESLARDQAAAEVAAREHEIAGELQASLLPQRSFDLRHLEVATYYRAGVAGTQVGGDWYDVIELSEARTALVVGDVMGRGVAAAAIMGQVRAAVRAYAGLGLPPAALVESMDAVVRDLAPDQMVTFVYAVFDPADLVLRFANAGHVPPFVRHADRSCIRLGGQSQPPLGIGAATSVTREVQLAPGATVVLYTDGLVERRGEHLETGIADLQKTVGALDVPLDEMPVALVRSRLPAGFSEDDVAVLVARVPASLAAGKNPAQFSR